MSTLLQQEPARAQSLTLRAGPLYANFARQRYDAAALDALFALAGRMDLAGAMRRLLDGETVNATEGRAALHTALRGDASAAPVARECAALGITMNAVSPGQIETPMLRKNIPAGTPVDSTVIPVGRVGQPEDVAAAIRYIVSPEASFITGATFDVNGGQRMQ